jgi:hypothetical protein
MATGGSIPELFQSFYFSPAIMPFLFRPCWKEGKEVLNLNDLLERRRLERYLTVGKGTRERYDALR